MNIKNVVIAGSGVLGSQIAFQTAYKGFNVTVYDVNDDALAAGKVKMETLKNNYIQEIRTAQEKGVSVPAGVGINKTILPNAGAQFDEALVHQVSEIPERIKFTCDLAQSVTDADLLIEAIPEVIEIKKTFYTQLAEVAPAKTIFVSNTSTLLPSTFAQYTGRPEKFLCLHFANSIWKYNTAEVMGHPTTDAGVYQQVVEFADAIGMIPLQLKKEQPRYILNSLLVPLLEAGERLFLNGVADPQTIDLTWRLATGAPLGPFQILDVVGITTAYNILLGYPDTLTDESSEHARLAKLLKEEYLDKGKTGIAAGEGFYKYK